MLKTRRKRTLKKEDLLFIVSILFLPMLGFTVVYVAVNFRSILMSFQTTLDGVNYSSVKMANFKTALHDIFNDADTKNIIANSFYMWFISALLMQVVTLFFSFAVWKKMPASKFFSVLLFLPSLLPSVVFTMLGRQAVNYAIPVFFGEGLGLLDGARGFRVVVAYGCFWTFGSNLVLQLGAMSSVDASVVEYGKIDGMNSWQEFIYIVFPHIYPTLISLFVMSIPGLFGNYGMLFDFFGEYASSLQKTFGLESYSVTLRSNGYLQYGKISALGLILSIFSVALSLGGKWFMEKVGPKEE